MSDNSWKKTALAQRKKLLEIIEKIKAEEQLNTLDQKFVIAVLRHAAESIPLVKPKSIGKPRKVEDRNSFLIEYAIKKKCGASMTKACEELADQYDISREAALKIIKDKKNTKEWKAATALISKAKIGR